jgi:hypothetical protein
MDPGELKRIEELSTDMYTSPSNEKREEAREVLTVLQQSVEYIVQCFYILEHSNNECALMMATKCLEQLVTNFWNAISAERSVDMSQMLLTVLGLKGTQFSDFVPAMVSVVLARITKLGWNDHDHHRNVLPMVEWLMSDSSSPEHSRIALNFLNALVQDMGKCSKHETNAKHRKIASNFRDNALKMIFQLCMNAFKTASGLKGTPRADSDEQQQFRECAVTLATSCLHFDFMNTDPDASEEEASTIQVRIAVYMCVYMYSVCVVCVSYDIHHLTPHTHTRRCP